MRGEEERKYRRENEYKCGKRRRREKKKVKDGGMRKEEQGNRTTWVLHTDTQG